MTLMVRTLLFNLVRRSKSKAVVVYGQRNGLGAHIVEAWAEAHAKSARLLHFDPGRFEDADVAALAAFVLENDDATIICLSPPSAPLMAVANNGGVSVICCMNNREGFVAATENQADGEASEKEAGKEARKEAGKEAGKELFAPKVDFSNDDTPSDVWWWLMSTNQSFVVWESDFGARVCFSEPVADDDGETDAALEEATNALETMGISTDNALGTLRKEGSSRCVNASIVTPENIGGALQVPREERDKAFAAIDAWRNAREHTRICGDECYAIGAAFTQGFDVSPIVVRGRPIRSSDGGGVRVDCCENMCFLTGRKVASQLVTNFAKTCEQYLAIEANIK